MIKVEHTNKTFSGKYGEVHALQDVSIHVEKAIFMELSDFQEQENQRFCDW